MPNVAYVKWGFLRHLILRKGEYDNAGNLQMQQQYIVQKHGENEPAALELKQRIAEMPSTIATANMNKYTLTIDFTANNDEDAQIITNAIAESADTITDITDLHGPEPLVEDDREPNSQSLLE